MRTISLVKMCASNVDNSPRNKPHVYTNLLPATTTRKIQVMCVHLLINTLDVHFSKRRCIYIIICNTQKDTCLLTHHLQSQRKENVLQISFAAQLLLLIHIKNKEHKRACFAGNKIFKDFPENAPGCRHQPCRVW